MKDTETTFDSETLSSIISFFEEKLQNPTLRVHFAGGGGGDVHPCTGPSCCCGCSTSD